MDETRPASVRALNAKQALFVSAYAATGKSAKSAISAGYSKKTAGIQAAMMLRKLHIRQAIRDEQDCIAKKAHTSPARTLREYARLAYANLQDCLKYDENGEEIPLKVLEMPREVAAAIKEYKRLPDGTVVLKFYDKQAALDSIGKHNGMFVDRQEISVTVERIERKIIDAQEPVETVQAGALSVIEGETE